MSKWGEIPIDIANKIAEHIAYYEDLESFGQVCSWWRHVRKNVICITPSLHTPCLLLAEPPHTSKRQLYNLCSGKIKHVELPEPPHSSKRQLFKILFNGKGTTGKHYDDLPNYDDYDMNGDWRYFSSHGWLISVTQFGLNVTLVNPFSREVINTPCIPEDYLRTLPLGSEDFWQDDAWMEAFSKLALSECPCKETYKDFTLAMIFPYNRTVGFWRSGDDRWIFLERKWVKLLVDINYYKGKFYVLDQVGNIMALGDGVGNPTVRMVAKLGWSYSRVVDPLSAGYLVESDGALLVVRREVDCSYENAEVGVESYRTLHFRVWEVDVDSGDVKEVKSLGNNKALFVGCNSSFSIKAWDGNGCKPNCIYYTDDNVELWKLCNAIGGTDMGVYDLASGCKIEDYYDGPSRLSYTAPPIWVDPYCCIS